MAPKGVDPNRPAIEANILLTAARLFAERGYSATSIQDISEAVGLQKSSLYHYVSGKEQLLFGALAYGMEVALDRLEPIQASHDTPREKLRKCVEASVLSVLERRHIVNVFLGDRRYLTPEHREQYVALRDRYEGVFREILVEGIAAGEFDDLNPSITVKGILGMCYWLVQWYSPTGPMSPEDIARFFAHVVVDRMLIRLGGQTQVRRPRLPALPLGSEDRSDSGEAGGDRC